MTDVPMKALPVTDPVIPDGVKASCLDILLSSWRELVLDFETDPRNVGHAFLYIAHHPMFWEIRADSQDRRYLMTGTAWYRAVEMGMSREGDGPFSVWIEAQPQRWPEDPTVDQVIEKDPFYTEQTGVSVGTFENAVTALAWMIHKNWGNDRESLKLPEEDPEGRWYG